MGSSEEFYRRAKESREKARAAATPKDQAKWIEIADAWDALARGDSVVTPPDAPPQPKI